MATRRRAAQASRTLKAHAASGEVPGGETHAGAEDPVTKEVDLEHLVHAGFDPEAAAHEDGLDPEDLGYDEEDSGAPPPPPPSSAAAMHPSTLPACAQAPKTIQISSLNVL